MQPRNLRWKHKVKLVKLQFLKFFTPKSILLWPTQIKEFSRKSYPTLLLITTPLYYETEGLVIKFSFYFSCIRSYSMWKKLRYTVNHSNKLMLTYFFCAVFKNLIYKYSTKSIFIYFKTKHSNETSHLGFYSLSNVFS